MGVNLISPDELPLTLGKWFWEHRDDLEHAVLVEDKSGFVVLRLDVDPPMDDDSIEDHRDGYVYVEIDGEALFAETAQKSGEYSVPTSADFRAGLRGVRGELQSANARVDSELQELRRFKQTTTSAATLVGFVVVGTLILRACG